MPRRKKFSIHKSWILVDGPMEVILTLHDHSRLALVAATRSPNTSKKPYVRTTIYLDKVQTQLFFHDLGQSLGYEMQSLSTSVAWKCKFRDSTMHPVAIFAAKRGTTNRRPLVNVAIFGVFGQSCTADTDAIGRITVYLSPRKALRIFKELAPLLGWELYEKDVAA